MLFSLNSQAVSEPLSKSPSIPLTMPRPRMSGRKPIPFSKVKGKGKTNSTQDDIPAEDASGADIALDTEHDEAGTSEIETTYKPEAAQETAIVENTPPPRVQSRPGVSTRLSEGHLQDIQKTQEKEAQETEIPSKRSSFAGIFKSLGSKSTSTKDNSLTAEDKLASISNKWQGAKAALVQGDMTKAGDTLAEVDEMLAERHANVEDNPLHKFIKGVADAEGAKKKEEDGTSDLTLPEHDDSIDDGSLQAPQTSTGGMNVRLTPFESSVAGGDTPRPSSPVLPKKLEEMTPVPEKSVEKPTEKLDEVPVDKPAATTGSARKRLHKELDEDTISVRQPKPSATSQKSNRLQKKAKKETVAAPVAKAPAEQKKPWLKSKIGTMKSTANLKVKASTDALKKTFTTKSSDAEATRRSTRLSEATIVKSENGEKSEKETLIEQINKACGICQVNIRPLESNDCAFVTLPKAMQTLPAAEVEKTIIAGCLKNNTPITGIYHNDSATKILRFGFVSDATAAVGRTIKFTKQSLKISCAPPASTFSSKVVYALSRTGMLTAEELATGISSAFPKEKHFQLFQRTADNGQVFTSDFTLVFWHSKLVDKMVAFPTADGRMLELVLRSVKDVDCKSCQVDKDKNKDSGVCGCYRLVQEVPAREVPVHDQAETEDENIFSDTINGGDQIINGGNEEMGDGFFESEFIDANNNGDLEETDLNA